MPSVISPFAMFLAPALLCPAHPFAPSQASATGAKPASPSWLVSGFIGESVLIFGSSEVFQGGGVSVQYERIEPRFRYSGGNAGLVLEAYYLQNHRLPVARVTSMDTSAYGLLAYARYQWPQAGQSYRIVADFGWGLQKAADTSRDLGSRLNSTPMLDIGVAFGPKHRETLVTLRLLHMSNASLAHRNRGQNQAFLMISRRM
jgi:hypothetical protein